MIKSILDDSLALQTKPIPSVSFFLSKHPKKISQLEDSIGNEGFMYLWKLSITGVEIEEIPVPFAFIKKAENYKSLDFTVSEELLSVKAVANDISFDSSPIKKDEFISVWNNWKKPVLEKYQKRNERLFDRETDRINRYYDVFPLRVEDKLRKLEEEKAQ